MNKKSYRLSQIWIYPVKSLPGIQLAQSEIDRRGFVLDRHWMLVDKKGRFVSQRKKPEMALISVFLTDDGIRLEAKDQQPLLLSLKSTSSLDIDVMIWGDRLTAKNVSEEANQWFSRVLDEPLTLVSMPDKTQRVVDQDYGLEGDQTGFSDGFPFLLLTESSVEDLNQRINNPNERMSIQRFRPNLVIRGAMPYEEDQWKKIKIGDVFFRVVKPCSRCTIPTINPQTAQRGVEPLKTLKSYRQKDHQVFFGQNLIHDFTGKLVVGDVVQVLSS